MAMVAWFGYKTIKDYIENKKLKQKVQLQKYMFNAPHEVNANRYFGDKLIAREADIKDQGVLNEGSDAEENAGDNVKEYIHLEGYRDTRSRNKNDADGQTEDKTRVEDEENQSEDEIQENAYESKFKGHHDDKNQLANSGLSNFEQKLHAVYETPAESVDINFGDDENLLPNSDLFKDKGNMFADKEFQCDKQNNDMPITFAQLIGHSQFEDNFDMKAASGLLLTETEQKCIQQ